MTRYRQCHECSWFDGNHAPHCRTRGYQHPSGTCRECGGIEGRHSWLCPVKPPASAPATAKCECGVDAAGQGGLHSSWCPRRT